LFQISHKVVAFVNSNRHVGIEFSDSGSSYSCARLADILLLEEKLGGKIGDGNGSGVIKGEGFNSSKSNVLG